MPSPLGGGPAQVLKYLARYTHRVALTNRHLLACDEGQVTFRWKDYAQGNRQQTMTLSAIFNSATCLDAPVGARILPGSGV
jgi:hypothetical protein